MTVFSTKNPKRQFPDLTREEKTVGQRIEKLIINADKYKNLNDLKKDFLEIIQAKDTVISKRKRIQYELDLAKIYSLDRMFFFITNIYQKAAGNSLDQ